jgi:hypothetical protein
MKKIFLICIFIYIGLDAANLDAIILKHDWSEKKIAKIEKILEISIKEFKMGLITLSDLTSWNRELFMEKKRKLDIEYEYKVKENPALKGLDFEESLDYVSALLNISIQQVDFYEKMLPSIKEMISIGAIVGRDLEIYKLDSLEAYSQYDYALKLYKGQHPKEKIPYTLPSDKLNEF